MRTTDAFRCCRYSLFGSLTTVLEDGIAPYLPRITTRMLYSLKSTEGVQVRPWATLSRPPYTEHLRLWFFLKKGSPREEGQDRFSIVRECRKNGFELQR